MKMVMCKIYIDNKGREKLLVLKFDYLIKHLELSKCIREYFVSPSNVHVKMKRFMDPYAKYCVHLLAKGGKVKTKKCYL
jgi:hypothetical protein